MESQVLRKKVTGCVLAGLVVYDLDSSRMSLPAFGYLHVFMLAYLSAFAAPRGSSVVSRRLSLMLCWVTSSVMEHFPVRCC